MLKLEGISKYYRGETTVTQALRRVDAEFKLGEFVVITGESGSGKSTLLNVLSGLDTYEEGEMYIHGEETAHYTPEDWEHYRSQYIGFVFQSYNIIDSYTVYQNVMSALIIQGYDSAKRSERAKALIEEVGLSAQMHQRSSTLSGGQKQRVSIARALAKDAPVIVADEPTGNLDKASGDQIIKLLKKISQDRLVIMVTHSYVSVKNVATRHLRLFDGEVVEDKAFGTHESVASTDVKPIYAMPLKDQLKLAFQNLFMMPKRLILMTAISIVIVAAIALVYGARTETTTSRSSSPSFYNSSIHRLIVTKHDQTAFTNDELNRLGNHRRVINRIDFDPAFEVSINLASEYQGYFQGYLTNDASALHQRQLTAGRLPENANEIVISTSYQHQIGDTVEALLSKSEGFGITMPRDENTDVSTNYASLEVEIVGFIDDWWNTAYLHPDFFLNPLVQYEAVRNQTVINFTFDATNLYHAEDVRIDIDNGLESGEIRISNPLKGEILDTTTLEENNLINNQHSITLFNHYLVENETTVTISSAFEDNYFAIRMSQETLESLIETIPYQITLTIEDGHSATVIQNAVSDDFHFIHPGSYQNPMFANFGIMFQIFNMIAVGSLLIVMYFITYITLKNTMQARKKDYIIFRSIGAKKTDLYKMTIYELMIVFAIAFAIVFSFLLLNRYVLFIITDYIRFYTFTNYLTVFLLLMALAVVTGFKFNQKIFKDSVITALRGE